jgi:hypothetical protein
LPALGIGLVFTLLFEWINSTALAHVPYPGGWTELGIFVPMYLAGVLLAVGIHGTKAFTAAGGFSALHSFRKFFKGLLLLIGVWLCFYAVCIGVSNVVLVDVVGLSTPDVRWLESEQFLIGLVLGTLLFGGPALEAKLAAGQSRQQADEAGH